MQRRHQRRQQARRQQVRRQQVAVRRQQVRGLLLPGLILLRQRGQQPRGQALMRPYLLLYLSISAQLRKLLAADADDEIRDCLDLVFAVATESANRHVTAVVGPLDAQQQCPEDPRDAECLWRFAARFCIITVLAAVQRGRMRTPRGTVETFRCSARTRCSLLHNGWDASHRSCPGSLATRRVATLQEGATQLMRSCLFG